MAGYVGETVLVTLRDPPDTKIRGLVTQIVDQQLCLQDVIWLPSQMRMEMYVVDGPGNLLDLEILAPDSLEEVPPAPSVEPDVDPAILSYVKPPHKSLEQQPSENGHTPNNVSQQQQDSKGQLSPSRPAAKHVTRDSTSTQQHLSGTSATLSGPFEDLSINGFKNIEEKQNGVTVRQQQTELPIKGKNRRRKARDRDQAAEVIDQAPLPEKAIPLPYDQSPNFNDKQHKRARGWRQTPLLEENTRPYPLGPNGKKLTRREKKLLAKMDKSGWATEDATDVQEMGDFDFSGNLSKFDKRGVFDQLKQEDTTADEDRLVNFNRLPPRAGTAGGKNLHFTENVLDSPQADSRRAWSSRDSEADGSEARFSSGRSSRRNMSRVSNRHPPSRKGSAITTDQQGSGSVLDSKVRTRWASRGPSGNSSMRIARDISTSRDTPIPQLPVTAPTKPSFYINSSDHHCPCLTPLQMLELEQLAVSECGIPDEMITENAARSIAEAAIQLTQPPKDMFEKGSDSSRPIVVLLAGNTKSGARAIAGARQLRNHGARVMMVLLGIERKNDVLDVVWRQIALYKMCGGQLTRPGNLSTALSNLHAKPDLIIDALLGMHLSFDDLRTDDQETYFEMARWVNSSAHVRVLAIDVPSGVDASIGSSGLVERTDVVIQADTVLSLGAPKTGLLSALGKSIPPDQIRLLLADIGIPNQAWRKFRTRSTKNGIEFGSEWVAGLRYQAGE